MRRSQARRNRLLPPLLLIAFLQTAPTARAIPAAPAAAREEVTVTLLETSDLHGNIFPYDYFTEKPAERGLAKIVTKVRQIRAERPFSLLLDGGDTIQGTPLAYLHNRLNNAPPDPMMLAMNEAGYDAMTVGNHEYNFGLAVLEKARAEARFPWLSANTHVTGGQGRYQPYLVKELGGVRIGILGLTTSNIPNWEDPPNYAGLVFTDTVAEAKKWVPVLRGKERCDLVVVLTHQGFERDLVTGAPNGSAYENQAYALATEVPGIDVLLTGHAHENVPPRLLAGVLVAQPKRWGEMLTAIDVRLARDAGGGRWSVVAKSGTNIPMDASVVPDPKILELAQPYHREALDYLSKVIGRAEEALTAPAPRVEDSALMDFLQAAQLYHSKAQLSLASLLPFHAPEIPAGPITVRQMFAFYLYDNTLYSVKVTGKQVRAALEHAANYFSGASCAADGRVVLTINPEVRSYNADMLEGADYRIDPTRPAGQRVTTLNYQGRPMRDDEVFTLALNNYRLAGGGGYQMFKGAQVIWKSSAEIRDLLISYVEKMGTIRAVTDSNWAIAPRYELRSVESLEGK